MLMCCVSLYLSFISPTIANISFPKQVMRLRIRDVRVYFLWRNILDASRAARRAWRRGNEVQACIPSWNFARRSRNYCVRSQQHLDIRSGAAPTSLQVAPGPVVKKCVRNSQGFSADKFQENSCSDMNAALVDSHHLADGGRVRWLPACGNFAVYYRRVNRRPHLRW